MPHPLGYTEQDNDLIRTMIRDGKTKREMAIALNRSWEGLKNYISRMRIKEGFSMPGDTCQSTDNVLRLLKEGKSINEIAIYLRWKASTVRVWARRFSSEGKIPYSEDYEALSTRSNRKYHSVIHLAETPLERKVLVTFTDYKRKCYNRMMEFNLDITWLREQLLKQHNLCFYTNAELSPEPGPYLITVDRLDSKTGYTKENCVLACYAANVAKHNLSVKAFIRLCYAVANTHPFT